MEIEIKNYEYKSRKHEKYLDYFPVIDSSISYDDFFQNHLLRNQACLVRNLATNWESSKFWTTQESRQTSCNNEVTSDNKQLSATDEVPNLKYLEEKYGNYQVTIYDCNEKYYNSQKTDSSVLKDYLEFWKRSKDDNLDTDEYKLLYLKDWHLKNAVKDDNFYKVPQIFASDWLNEYLSENSLDDYRFVYMGPKGTWTPFHADVFTSYSWSVNICGQKKWILFPPGEEQKLKDSLGNLIYDVNQADYSICKSFEVIQNAGDGIFVPSNWHHQVWNLKDTISINHNWVNGCNILTMYESIRTNLDAVKSEISDCKDMENFYEHCQVVLNASFGLDYYRFYDFLKYISTKRINCIKDNKVVNMLDGYTLGKNHAIFDLLQIKAVLENFVDNEDVLKLDKLLNCDVPPKKLLSNIVDILNTIK